MSRLMTGPLLVDMAGTDCAADSRCDIPVARPKDRLMTALLPAELAWYAAGRFYRAHDGAQADYGYFLHLPFPDAPLFDGRPGETTAHFTFADPASFAQGECIATFRRASLVVGATVDVSAGANRRRQRVFCASGRQQPVRIRWRPT